MKTTTNLRGVPLVAGHTQAGDITDALLRRVPLPLAMFGATMFAIGTVLLVWWADALAKPGTYGSFHALGLTHVFALGFVTSMVMAVLYVFIPSNFHANVHGLRRAQFMGLAYAISVLLFTVSLGAGYVVVAALAGPLLAIAIAVFLSQMFSVVVRAKRRTLEGGFHMAAFIALAVVIVLGSLLATSLPTGWIPDVGTWLSTKIVLAVAGWLGMIVVGVSYHTVKGLNGSRARPRLVIYTLGFATVGVWSSALLILVNAPVPLRATTMCLLVIATCLYGADVAHLVRNRASSASAITWVGHLIGAGFLVVIAVEGVAAMIAGPVWAAMAVTGFLLAFAPTEIVANGNRIIPVLIGNRYNGHGRHPLGANKFGRFGLSVAIFGLIISWAFLQMGILVGSVLAIRVGGVAAMAAVASFDTTIVRQVLSARNQAANPEWVVTPISLG